MMLSSDDEMLLMYYLYLQTRRKRYSKTKPKSDAKRMRLSDNDEANIKDIDKFTSHLATELIGMPIKQSTMLQLDIDALVKTAKTGCENFKPDTSSDITDSADSNGDTDNTSSASEDSSENELMDQDPLSISSMYGKQCNENTQKNSTASEMSDPIAVPGGTKHVNLNLVKEETEEDFFETEDCDLEAESEVRAKNEVTTFLEENQKPMTVPIEISKSLDLDIVKNEIDNEAFVNEGNDLEDVEGNTTGVEVHSEQLIIKLWTLL